MARPSTSPITTQARSPRSGRPATPQNGRSRSAVGRDPSRSRPSAWGTDPKIEPRLGARQHPAERSGAGWNGRCGSGCLVACSGGVRFGFGDAAEGDFESEGAELADVVRDLAVDVAAAFVVVRAEVLIAHAGAGQQLVVDLQLGVPDGDQGFGLAAPAGQPPVAGAFAGLGLADRRGGFAGDGGQVPVALLGFGSSGPRAGLVVQRGAPGPGG